MYKLDPRTMFAYQVNVLCPTWLKPCQKTSSSFNILLFSPESPATLGSLHLVQCGVDPQLNQQPLQAEVFKRVSLLVALSNSVFTTPKGSREDCSTGRQRRLKTFSWRRHVQPLKDEYKLYKLGIEELALDLCCQI